MKRLHFLLHVTLALALVSTGCPREDDDPPPPQTLAMMAITDARSLIIAPSEATPKAMTGPGVDRLFKVTDTGYIEEVTYYDENGLEMDASTLIPNAIYRASDTYILVRFPDAGYFVRNTDGAVFALGTIASPDWTGYSYENYDVIQTDGSGNLYFIATDQATLNNVVYKVDVTNPSALSAVRVTPSSESASVFLVDSSGNILYNHSGTLWRVRTVDQALHNIPSLSYALYWLGPDDHFYVQIYTGGSPAWKLQRIDIDGSYNVVLTDFGVGYDAPHSAGQNYRLSLQNRVIIAETGTLNAVTEVYGPSTCPRSITTLPPFNNLKIAAASDSYYYLAGDDASSNPVLLRVNPLDDTYTTLLSAGEYDIFLMNASSDGVVTFNALRMADGVKVIGTVDGTGLVTILDEDMNNEIYMLERVD